MRGSRRSYRTCSTRRRRGSSGSKRNTSCVTKPEAHIPTLEYERKHPVLANPGETQLMQHMPQLDGIRAIAVLMVLWWHFMPSPIAKPGAAPWGAIGVGLFFTLSGFLITRILLNCRLKIDDG